MYVYGILVYDVIGKKRQINWRDVNGKNVENNHIHTHHVSQKSQKYRGHKIGVNPYLPLS